MCGIVGYVGDKEATPILLEGLERLEYRGYDSAGIAVNSHGKIEIVKREGKLDKLKARIEEKSPDGEVGIGHTRWATHGEPSDRNAHPHVSMNGDFVIAHNGIIENYQELKEELEKKDYVFASETDTEIIVHLLEDSYRDNIKQAIINVVEKLEGSYALAILSTREPDKLYGVRKDSPLIVGKAGGENFLASDIPAYLKYTEDFYILEDGEIAEIKKNKINLYNEKGEMIDKELFVVDWDPEMAEKNGYDHFMLKEINEQPSALRRVLENRISPAGIDLQELKLTEAEIKNLDKIQIVACGTASHSGLLGKYVLEELAEIPVEVEVASEYRYRKNIMTDNTLIIVVSQSGETADTLACLRLAQKKGVKVLALTNVVGSSIAREADEVLYLHAGPEIAVASTKAYTNMLAAFYLLAVYFADVKESISRSRRDKLIQDILRLPELTEKLITDCEGVIKDRARDYQMSDNSFFIGRNTDYTLAMEGALKLKEISYIHAEAYPAGELKHGTLALIEEGIPVIAIATRKGVFDKMLSNIKEVKARGADVLAVVFNNAKEIINSVDNVIFIPEIDGLISGVLTIIPLQLLAYYTALERECDIDQPRNLAKSVTVE